MAISRPDETEPHDLFNPFVFPKKFVGDKNMLVTGTHKNRGVICTLGRLRL